MKAAVLHGFDQPLSLEDVAVSEPGPEQVLARMVFWLADVPTSAPKASVSGVA